MPKLRWTEHATWRASLGGFHLVVHSEARRRHVAFVLNPYRVQIASKVCATAAAAQAWCEDAIAERLFPSTTTGKRHAKLSQRPARPAHKNGSPAAR